VSGDFDPRLMWTRRQAAAAIGAGVAAAGLAAGGAGACDAEWAGRGGRKPVLVSGAEIAGADARRLAHLAGATLAAMPVEADPLRFWTALAPRLHPGAPVLGVTGWADFLVLRGAAAESRLRVRFQTGAGGRTPVDSPELEDLAERLRAALADEPAAAGRIGWMLA
jgi:hypothetical protein